MKEILGVKLYDVVETSELLGVSATTIHTKIRNKMLEARKIGTKWYIKEETIKEFIGAGGQKSNE